LRAFFVGPLHIQNKMREFAHGRGEAQISRTCFSALTLNASAPDQF